MLLVCEHRNESLNEPRTHAVIGIGSGTKELQRFLDCTKVRVCGKILHWKHAKALSPHRSTEPRVY